jgi:murein DD-endopeptidase MepM/ murein hydrolase activator NlpD
MLMTQMLREMRRSMLDEDDQQEGLGGSTLTDTMDVELGQALSKSGGIGLADVLLRAWQKQFGDSTSEGALPNVVAAAAAAAAGKTPAGMAAPTILNPSDVTDLAPISSAFGWRQDPVNGSARFHKGLDIAVAYGADVKAAAPGRVSFSGVQNGYGNTVVIDHEGGRQTRYAHLSEQLVRVGDVVAEGQLVGKSGNSGRTTGPHLHFELLVDGQPVNPFGS